MNTLSTIPFKVTLFAIIITFDILIFPQTSGNHLSYPCSIMFMRVYINCISDSLLLAFNGLIIHLHRELAFLEARDFIIICLAPEFDIILFTAEVNLCKNSLKAFFGPCITLVNDSIFFPISPILSQAFKAAVWHKSRVWSSYTACLSIVA